jgi:fluoride exporter
MVDYGKRLPNPPYCKPLPGLRFIGRENSHTQLNNMLYSILIISLGASCGAVLRWLLGLQLNALFPTIPPGTLAANLIGGYLVGIAVGYFGDHPLVSPEMRLLILTGFLGGLTTFSTFSAEVVTLLQAGRIAWALGSIALHVMGSVLLTILGILTVHYFQT